MSTRTLCTRSLVALTLAAAPALSGCGEDLVESTAATAAPTGSGALALRTDMNADTGVVGVHYRAAPVDCETGQTLDGELVEAVTDLSDVRLPGMIPGFEDSPLDAGSSHVMADQYLVLPAGCYDVVATPVDEAGNASEDCSPAVQPGVQVYDGVTTEILLVSQCGGPQVGGLDVILTLNHPPQLVDLTYGPDKFLFECEMLTLCATFHDPDGDPMRIEWSNVGHDWAMGPAPVSRTFEDGTVTECVQVAGSMTGRYDFEVQAFDLLHADGALMTFEQWHAERGVPRQSRDGIASHWYVNWDTEARCIDEAGALQLLPGAREIQRAPACNWISPERFFCNPGYVDDVEATCPGGTFDPSTVYPACDAAPERDAQDPREAGPADAE